MTTDRPRWEPTRAACVGLHTLFDATDPASHREAATICATCPVRAGCADQLAAELTAGRTLRGCGGGPRGTWAGRLIGKPRVKPSNRRSARENETRPQGADTPAASDHTSRLPRNERGLSA